MFPTSLGDFVDQVCEGSLQMRTSRASLVPFKNSLWRAFSLTVGLMRLASLLVIEGSTSAANLASTWVGGPQQFPQSLQHLQLPPPPFHLSQWGRCTHRGCPQQGTPPPAHPWCHFCPHHLKQSSNQSEIVAGFFEVACSLFILLLMAILFQTGALIGEWQKSGVELHIFWRGRTDNSKRLWRGR